MKRLFLILLIGILSLSSCAPRAMDADTDALESVSYLLLGLDDAAQNTDVIAVVSYNHVQNRLSFVQIPRDTYYAFSTGQNKINQLYATYVSSMDKAAAAHAVLQEISELFGLRLDGYVALTTAGFRSVVDALGGIDINIPEDMTVYDENGEDPMTLSRGVHHLSGAESERFVRFRRGYAMGDLGRLDAQKIFFSALLMRARSIRIEDALALLTSLRKQEFLCAEGLKITKEGLIALARLDNSSISYLTLPGESITFSGVSYYVLNRRASMDALAVYAGADRAGFDRGHRLYRADELSFKNIYFDKNMGYRKYTEDNIGNMHIPTADK